MLGHKLFLTIVDGFSKYELRASVVNFITYVENNIFCQNQNYSD